MLKQLIALSKNLEGVGLAAEANAIRAMATASYVIDDDYLQKQIAYFRKRVHGSPAKEYIDSKTGKKKVKKATLPQPLSILAPYYKGWSEDQIAVYPHLKREATEILLSEKVQINWQNPVPEDAQYMYFELSTPDGNPLYKDEVLSEFERVAAEITAEKFPDYFVASEYLNDSFPELARVAEEAKADEAYFDGVVEGYEDLIEYSEDD